MLDERGQPGGDPDLGLLSTHCRSNCGTTIVRFMIVLRRAREVYNVSQLNWKNLSLIELCDSQRREV